MNWSIPLGAVAVASAVASGVAGSYIADFLIARGVNVNRRHFAMLRRSVLGYLRAYRDATVRETGRVGLHYYLYIFSMVGTILFIVGAIMLRYT